MDDPDHLFTLDKPYISGTAVLHQPEAEEMDDLEEDDPEEVSTLMQDSDAYSESEDDLDDGTMTASQQHKGVWMQRLGRPQASVMISQ